MKSLLILAFGFWAGLHYSSIMSAACPATRQFPLDILMLDQVTAVGWLCEPFKEVKP